MSYSRTKANALRLILCCVAVMLMAAPGSIFGAGKYNLSATLSLSFASPPQIFDLSPQTGHTGAQVTIDGSGFTGATAVQFNGTPDPGFSFVNDGQIIAHVPPLATTGSVKVTTASGFAVSPLDFVVDNTPPSTPVFTSTNPVSPANENHPHILGTAEAFSTVALFTAADCSGDSLVVTADVSGNFDFQVTVPNNSSTTFYAHTTDAAGNTSPCTSLGITYVDDTTLSQGSICGTKFLDHNGDGVAEPGDSGQANWTIVAVSSVGDTLTTTTDSSGHYCFYPANDTGYVVYELTRAGYIQTGGQPYYHIHKASTDQVTGIDFGNFREGQIYGSKFNDLDSNGVRGPGEPAIGGWPICLTGATHPRSIDFAHATSTLTFAFGANTPSVPLDGLIADRRGGYDSTSKGVPFGLLVLDLHSTTKLHVGSSQYDVHVSLQVPSPQSFSSGFTAGTDPDVLPVSSFFDVFVEIDLIGVGGSHLVNKSSLHLSGTVNGLPFPQGSQWTGGAVTLYEKTTGFNVAAIQSMTIVLGDTVSPSSPVCTTTDTTGTYSFTDLPPGIYTVNETQQPCWTQTSVSPSPVTISSGDSVTGVDFGNHGNGGMICVRKYYDQNHNQIWDAGEPVMAGVTFHLQGQNTALISSGVTDDSGNVCFSSLLPDNYTVTEDVPQGYEISVPKAGFLNFQITACDTFRAVWGNSAAYTDSTFRTATVAEWALSPDQKGKPKPVKPKPDKVDFKFNLLFRTGDLLLKFPMFATGDLRVGKTKATSVVAHWDSVKQTFISQSVIQAAAGPGDTLQFDGRGFKGKAFTVTYQWTTNGGLVAKGTLPSKPATPRADTLKQSILRLPMPDLHNIGADMQLHGAFPIMVGASPDSHVVIIGKYADVLKSLVKSSKGVNLFHTDSMSCLSILKPQKTLPPGKFNVALAAELLVLKLNILASQRGYFPPGLDTLVYDYSTVEPGHPLNGSTVGEIGRQADQIVTCSGDPKNLHLTPLDYYTVLHRINAAFASDVIDTFSWSGGQVVMRGVRPLKDVPYLHVNPGVLHPQVITYVPMSAYEPMVYKLAQNYPNPFNPTTTIQFELPEPAVVSLKVYNILGQEVATLLDQQPLEDGVQEVEFDATALSSGVYFYRIIAQGTGDPDAGIAGKRFIDTRKMLLIK